jgi:hypothetical protein
MEPDVLNAAIHAIGVAAVAGLYVKGKVLFSIWLDERFGFWKASLIYSCVTIASFGAIALLL